MKIITPNLVMVGILTIFYLSQFQLTVHPKNPLFTTVIEDSNINLIGLCYTLNMFPSDRKKLEELAKKFRIHFILLFGSKAEGRDTYESDIDIAIYAEHVLSEEEKIDLVFEFSSILKTEKIDLVDLKTAPALLKKKIFDSYKVLFLNNPFLLYQAELSSLQEYEESKILYKIRDERLKEFISD